jgi:hypothetical protein
VWWRHDVGSKAISGNLLANVSIGIHVESTILQNFDFSMIVSSCYLIFHVQMSRLCM